MSDALLELRGLTVDFATDDGVVHAVDGIDLALGRGRTLGLVGESGCGKSVTSLAIMGLLPPENSKVGGQVVFEGRDLLTLDAHLIRDLRGARLAMIFQEPMTSLNPSYTIGDQIIEAIQRHQRLDKAAARARAIEVLKLVRIPSPEKRIDDYPHKLSGGMRQRAMIAMALACGPQLLIADEPTTALDVTIQAQILDLMRGLRRDTGTAIILITHDLGVVAEMADDVAVMYAGQIVERAAVRDLFARPEHPYTVGLLGSIPRLDEKRERLPSIEGRVPDMTRPPPGCRFAARCPFAEPACVAAPPALVEVAPGHLSRCRRAPLSQVVA
ncbi:ABC transporter ATP-binding protein [Reyranella sp.]|jgi:peptide/nickel transport system ATP-binding protein|uniref:ABC transporter ATP-binding protein n=1 Tax=Reyranella sp. TaxID=1929291 RepID=UPI000BD44D76|nr:ABC transporter ATP-binding protein [Reyranella sp.]OYY40259.1 MAG: dipeptide ABC transporter ATP-binding protein DppD [Rhodospirillales bacterium 35-66-84]OYZ92811.1 MAG: dipeptide ABC transporter ATP-binding protein DppD [Rhodospirillales bacterium 24-66-33]OZB22532.1 MAG: dipeptide ABC transporter ATP-binding protein DppD [Rhodospirillales bacterium 39-66-50]HQS18947.1 ABC transporter ATP-binding protein [Reyranella sp.]HQT12284.1 ABC transporter ATP-binding protein [Reyranella sp.]